MNLMTLINVLVVVVLALHVGFMVLEMFFWTKPIGLKVFAQKIDKARDSAVLAQNQGLYNGFLAAGLLWGLLHPQPEVSHQIKFFFLACVVVAGLFGAFTVSKKIFFVQAAPALLPLFLLWVI
ncbi:DUF1304 domain-containing protein [Pseudobdellovibrio exovorus]|uniref:Integral membrane protein n=1 Tax=Pseudobdellovibrio exovorus JSS TaxID=1184267 RepID=M4VRI0_9BACT|nr:DUF1304 domain-containing protein [Pseudobdellovibrio exovorus]AGH95789.1 hypothetical protein A11Q_1573 [Pseudobdellovibrio exovorus JSS]